MQKSVFILGGGRSGIGSALLAKKQGYEVFLSDGGKLSEDNKAILHTNDIPYEEGKHSWDKLVASDVVIKSPGIRPSTAVMQFCISKHIQPIDEMEFAYLHKGDSTLISITGANGKTTTASLLYHIIRTATEDVALVGNIGNSFAGQIAKDPKSIYVAEISSFQLDYTSTYNSDIAILTNITPDHLDEYEHSLELYAKSKFQLIKNQQANDIFIYNLDDPITVKTISNYQIKSKKIPFSFMRNEKMNDSGAYVDNDQLVLNVNENNLRIPLATLPLLGKHNQYNTMAAGLAASAMRIKKETIQKAILSFQAVDHRMEFVGTFQGVTFINDSKATNINSTWYALESMSKPVVLLIGGKDKGNDYEDIKDLVKQKVKGIVCIGVDNKKIITAFGDVVNNVIETTSMETAVKEAFAMAERGDVVLLSPACASFDVYKNYEERGAKFKEAIMNLEPIV